MWSALEFGAEDIGCSRDVHCFDALLARITSQFDIDLRRIYLIGMIIGVSFARLLANAKLDGGSCSRLFRGENHRSLRC